MGDLTFLARPVRLAALSLAFAAAVVGATPAHAKNRATNTLAVKLTVGSNCRLATNPLLFGTVTTSQKTASASTTMTLTCTPGTIYTASIDDGKWYDGTTRRMWGGQANGQVWFADYQLYQDAAHLLPWGSGLTTTQAGVVPLSGQATLTLYGVAQLKNVRAAPYIDTVTVTIDF